MSKGPGNGGQSSGKGIGKEKDCDDEKLTREAQLQCCEADVWPKGRLAGRNATVLPKKAGVGISPRTARPSSTSGRGTFVSVEFDQTRAFTGRGELRVLCRASS